MVSCIYITLQLQKEEMDRKNRQAKEEENKEMKAKQRDKVLSMTVSTVYMWLFIAFLQTKCCIHASENSGHLCCVVLWSFCNSDFITPDVTAGNWHIQTINCYAINWDIKLEALTLLHWGFAWLMSPIIPEATNNIVNLVKHALVISWMFL